MSKITPKNLEYDTTLPPFLQRLQGQNSGRDGRHDFQTARPKRARNEDDEREDEPVYFDEESGETLTKGEWEDREKQKEGSGDVIDGEGDPKKTDEDSNEKNSGKDDKEKEKVAAIGAGKKRKAGRIVGGDEDPDGQNGKATELKKLVVEKKNEVKKVNKGAAAKKGKKIKLSFGDDE